jgi:LacI family transcriptional regulator
MKKVVLIIDIARASGRQFLRGIERFMHTHQSWEVYIQPPNFMSNVKHNLNKWIQPKLIDGIILRDATNMQNILKLKIPKIIFGSRREVYPGVPIISSDSYGISKMAADYFIGLGFRNFAYCGFNNIPWSKGRFEAYREIIMSKKEFNFYHFNSSSYAANTIIEKQDISEWLKTLPKPICILTCNDERGIYVLEACKIAHFKVPEDAAVLGIDNDDLICNLSSPPLSSIKVGFEQAGFKAADILDREMNGEKNITNITIKAEAVDIIKRQSSDIIVVNDEDVTKALIFIRENFQKSILVVDVVDAVHCSRRMLEMRFKNSINRSINDEINRYRIEYIKRNLINSNIPINKIASSLQFTDSGHFSRFFKKITTITPTEYRSNYEHVLGRL